MTNVNTAGFAGTIYSSKTEKIPELYGRKDLYKAYMHTMRDTGGADTVVLVFDDKAVDLSERKVEAEVLNLKPHDFITMGESVIVFGRIQTMRNQETGHMETFCMCENIFLGYAAPQNEVQFEGYLITGPTLRNTPRGRRIADMTVAVQSCFDNSFKCRVPVICWESVADRAADELLPGNRVSIKGRLQSRLYDRKNLNGEMELVTYYEISAGEVTKI